jgi:hypothetical protein
LSEIAAFSNCHIPACAAPEGFDCLFPLPPSIPNNAESVPHPAQTKRDEHTHDAPGSSLFENASIFHPKFPKSFPSKMPTIITFTVLIEETGQAHALSVADDYSMRDLKNIISTRTKIPTKELRLTRNGRSIPDRHLETVTSAGIRASCRVHVIRKPSSKEAKEHVSRRPSSKEPKGGNWASQFFRRGAKTMRRRRGVPEKGEEAALEA